MSSPYVKLLAAAAAAGTAVAFYMFFNSSTDHADSLASVPKSDEKSGKDKDLYRDENGVLKLPVVDFECFFNRGDDPKRYSEECRAVAHAFQKYGIVIVKDPRVFEKDNIRFLNLMERYFEGSDGVRDARPEFHFQVGVTPNHTERARDQCSRFGAFGPDNKPLSPCPPELDPKWRFFWRTGPQPKQTEFSTHNMDAVIPPEFPEWKEVMDLWGGKMTDALFTVAEMAAVGFGMEADSFTSRMMYGPHLLAPTGSDLEKFGTEGTVLAGFHYDLNFMTIHGKSRFPGLSIWTRSGEKTSVHIPDGCLLVQAGKQFEYLTGGRVLAGFHEVVVNSATAAVIAKRSFANKSLWRVSSTCFGHIQSDQVLQPLPPFDTQTINGQSPDAIKLAFPPIKAGHQVLKELQAISLAREA